MRINSLSFAVARVIVQSQRENSPPFFVANETAKVPPKISVPVTVLRNYLHFVLLAAVSSRTEIVELQLATLASDVPFSCSGRSHSEEE